MTSRISQLASHLDPRTWSGKGLAAHRLKSDDDVVFVAAGRTAFCKAGRGGLKDTKFDVLVLEFFKALLAKGEIDPTLIQDIVVGNVREPRGVYDVRAAALAAGIPNTVPCMTVNRFCSSGFMAIRTIANQIQAGEIDCGLAVGAESMTYSPRVDPQFSEEISKSNQEAADCELPMGWTAENVAGDFGISRQKMDEYAARSQQRAAAAQASGKFDAEILPISVPEVDKNGTKKYKVVAFDDGIRAGTTAEALAKLKPAFPQWAPAQTTGGNASQITDGAAGVILMRRSLANKLGKKIVGKYVACAVAGLEPRIMGIGPSVAIPKVLELTGIKKEEVDVYEINEAFASMYVYCVEKLGLDPAKVNVNGGACALGHPLGATGARQAVTALAELERSGGSCAVVSACIGTGMGYAAVILSE